MKRQKKGFTLIELLVVIAIIAILAAILFPVFARARDKGREASCKSNLKQLGSALQLYLDDWEGCYPDFTTTTSYEYGVTYNNQIGQDWITKFSNRYKESKTSDRPMGIGLVLRPYVKGLSVFKCPSEHKTRPHIPGYAEDEYHKYSSYYVKHAMNLFANYKKRPLRLSDIKFPTRAAFIYEEGWHNGKQSPYLYDPLFGGSPPPNDGAPFMRVNAIYFDCHVAPMQIPYLSDYKCYTGHWYWYNQREQKIPDANGITNGWQLDQGMHDKQ